MSKSISDPEIVNKAINILIRQLKQKLVDTYYDMNINKKAIARDLNRCYKIKEQLK